MEAKEAADILKAKVIGGGSFETVSTDSRKVQENSLFFALKGENFDGHDFVADALAKGAKGAVVSNYNRKWELKKGQFILLVEDTLAALMDFAGNYRRKFKLPVIAVTGSVGKTTTKDLIYAVLAQKWSVLRSEQNFNNEIGLSMTLLNLKAEHQALVLEMGMRGEGQIRRLCEMALPAIGVLTSITSAHYELLGSMEAIAGAKAELLESLPADGLALINGENEWCLKAAQKSKAPVWFYGIEGNQTIRALSISSLKDKGLTFKVKLEKKESNFFLPLLGLHNVRNALAAIGLGYYFGLTADEIQAGLEKAQISAMRLAKVKGINDSLLLNDTYNAHPESVKSALDTLAELPAKRHGAVLGDMLELGSLTFMAHQEVGSYAARKGLDYLVAIGEMAPFIAEAARKLNKKMKVKEFKEKEEALLFLQNEIKKGDAVLFKASRRMHLEEIVEALREGENDF